MNAPSALRVLDCFNPGCYTTWYSREAGPHSCGECGWTLHERIPGTVPFMPGSYVDGAVPEDEMPVGADGPGNFAQAPAQLSLPLFAGGAA